jgi:hypothetical protein
MMNATAKRCVPTITPTIRAAVNLVCELDMLRGVDAELIAMASSAQAEQARRAASRAYVLRQAVNKWLALEVREQARSRAANSGC